MKPIYTNITTSPATTTLMERSSDKQGAVNKITISNFSDHADGATVNLFLQNASAADFYFIKNFIIMTAYLQVVFVIFFFYYIFN